MAWMASRSHRASWWWMVRDRSELRLREPSKLRATPSSAQGQSVKYSIF